MILHSVEHSGSRAFPDPITVQWDQLPETVAISGPIGQGKTMLLELLPAALFLTMPFRPGPLYKHFVTRGIIKYQWSLDRRYTSTVLVDPRAERVEAMLSDADGPIAGPKQADYLQAVTQRIGSLDLFCMRAFAVQPSYTSVTAMSLLKASRAERREVFAELLMLSRYAAREGYAKRRSTEIAEQRLLVQDQVTLAQEAVDSAPEAERQLGAFTIQRDAATLELDTTIQSIAALRARMAVLRAEYQATQQRTQQQQAARTRLEEQRARLTFEADALRARLDRAPQFRQAARDLTVLMERRGRLDQQIEEAAALITAAQDREQQRAQLGGAIQLAEAKQRTLQRQALIVGDVPCHGEGPYAACQFLVDAMQATRDLPAATEAVAALRTQLAELPAPDLQLAETSALLRTERATLESRIQTLSGLAALAARLPDDERTLANYERDLAATADDLAQLGGETADTQLAEIAARGTLLKQEEQTLEQAAVRLRQRQSTADQAVGRYQALLERTAEQAARLPDLIAEAARLQQDVIDWDQLARVCGASGIPARKVDAALPAIQEVANQLLSTFADPFTVELVTQKKSADEKRLLETLECVVRRNGEPLAPEWLSGGQGVLVSEAISMAITLYQRQGDLRLRTLMRDEVSAMLDAEAAGLYVDMLREAMRAGQFTQGIFVSHHPTAIERADGRLFVQDGRITRQ